MTGRGYGARALAAAAACALGLGVVAVPAGAAGAFAATATAYAEDVSIAGTSLPLGASAEGATPLAQAAFDSLPTSKGFASALFPGDFTASVPGLVAGQTKQQLPPYPLSVSSDAGTAPTGETSGPGFSLGSKSNGDGSHATASEGSSAAGSQLGYAAADATSKRTADGVQADAASTLSGFSVGATLAFGTITSTAHAVVDGAGHVTTKSQLEVSGLRVNGQAFGFADGRFVAPGTSQPLPTTPISDALAKAGVSVTYLAEQKLANGVASPALQVVVTQPGPPGTPADGTYTASYTLGRALATIDHSAAPASAASVSSASPVADPTAGAVAPAVAGSGSPSGVGDIGGGATSPSSGSPALSTSAPLAVSRRLPAEPGGLPDAEGIYLAVAFAAALLAASTQLVRHLGVRTPWTS